MSEDKDTPRWGEDPEPEPKRTSRSRSPRDDEPKGLPEAWPRAQDRRRSKVRYLGQGTYVCNGPSGEEYRFVGHGCVLKVKADDRDDVVGRVRVQRTCCGRAGERVQHLFTLA